MSVISKRLCVATVGMFGLSMASMASAAIYNGNGATGFGGPIGNGNLAVTADGAGNVTFTLNNAGSFSGNDLVVYIDSVAGGFANTSQFADNGGGDTDGGRTAISAESNTAGTRENVSFPTGFGADYALEFENDTYDGLFQLNAGGDLAFNYITGNGPSTVGGPYVVTVPLSDLGLTTGQGFSFVGNLISTTAYGSNETIGSSVVTSAPGSSPNAGATGSIAFTSADVFGTPVAVPEPASLGVLALAGLFGVRRKAR